MRYLTLTVLVLCLGCVPTIHSRSVPALRAPKLAKQMVTASPFVRLEWALMEVCVGMTGDIDKWKWYIVKLPHWFEPVVPGEVIGFADGPNNTIYLAEDVQGDISVIRHEIMHALGVRWHTELFAWCGASESELKLFTHPLR